MATQKTINTGSTIGDVTILDLDSQTSHADIIDYAIIVSGAGTIIIKDAAVEYGRYTFGASGGSIVRPALPSGERRFVCTGDLVLNLSTTLTVTGDLTYSIRQ